MPQFLGLPARVANLVLPARIASKWLPQGLVGAHTQLRCELTQEDSARAVIEVRLKFRPSGVLTAPLAKGNSRERLLSS